MGRCLGAGPARTPLRLVDKFDAFVIDLDGTVVSGPTPVKGVAGALKKLRKTGKPFLFATNNSRLTPAGWAKRLKETGIEARAGEIVTSAGSTARFITRKFKNPESKKAFVSASRALVSEIKKTGIRIVGADEAARGCDVVIIGGYTGFGYQDIAAAGTAIIKGADFLATNSNFVYPARDGRFMPATGALTAAIEKVARKKPVITGKPHPDIFRICREILRVAAGRTAVIGDSLKTDIKGGKNAGMKTVLTLTGISSRADAKKSRHKPDYIIKDMSELFR